ncbi:MAG: TerC family protein [Proteobacteria bacterium]|nr:TerC family protein [Pseudomonadota bacterium]
MDSLLTSQFWIPLLEIIGVNIVLSGDNAVVIALAARSLPPRQQRKAVIFGSIAAIIMRVILTLFAVELLKLPYLKLIGSTLLLWIGIQLLVPEEGDGKDVESKETLFAAIKTILVADLVMSIDNVIGVAAAARGNVTLLVLGLAISIPLIIFGSSVMLKFMERFPVIVTLGGALLGYIAGEMAVSDIAISPWLQHHLYWIEQPAGFGGAILVVAVGRWLSRRQINAGKDRVV